MKDYNEYLKEQFGNLEINLVKHDTSPTGCPTYIEVKLGKMPKDKGTVAKDLSNYLFRMGLQFQSCPEYLGKGKNAVLRFYMTWAHIAPFTNQINEKFGKGHIKAEGYLALEFRSLIIQNVSRGVFAREAS